MTNVYLAGKIGKNDWRHTLCKGLRETVRYASDVWQPLPDALGPGLNYTGPFFSGCDHGCCHAYDGGNHGVMESTACEPGLTGVCFEHESQHYNACMCNDAGRTTVVFNCLEAIMQSDLIFAWFDEDTITAYGTLAELGYAAGWGKKIVITGKAGTNWLDDLWFPLRMRNGSLPTYDYYGSAEEAFDIEVRSVYKPDLSELTESPIEKAFWLAYAKVQPPELAGLTPQVEVGQYRVDFGIPDRKIAIEADGFEYHSSREHLANDRVRQRVLETAGWKICRFSGREIHNDALDCVKQAAAWVAGQDN
jgi:very-short-patch-repair endonuclease